MEYERDPRSEREMERERGEGKFERLREREK